MGYSSQRKSRYNGNQVYGLLQLPSSYAGICPAPNNLPANYRRNVLPELFFGFYNSGIGFDIGVQVDTGGTWVAFNNSYGSVFTNVNNNKMSLKKTLKAGDTLWMKAYISGSKCFFNVSKTSYTGTDLLDAPWEISLTTSFANMKNYEINREIAIAQGADVSSTYETSGAYLMQGKWLQCGYVDCSSHTYVWTDDNSYAFSANSREIMVTGAGGRSILRIRKDEGTVNSKRIKTARTNGNSGATETTGIDFTSNPNPY